MPSAPDEGPAFAGEVLGRFVACSDWADIPRALQHEAKSVSR